MLYIKYGLLLPDSSFCIYKNRITSDAQFISTCLPIKNLVGDNTLLWISIDCAVLRDLYGGHIDKTTSLYYLNEESRMINNFDVVAKKYRVYSQKDKRFKPLLLSLQEMILSYHKDIFVKCITDILLM